jgi:ribulose-5-phosphate 4-epimerase/fuculose-1-phosphate aldolase
MDYIDELVIAYRVLASHGVVDAYGHVSLRHPENPERYFIARALAPELVTRDDIFEFDLDSDVIDTDGRADGVSMYLERYIHGEIFKERADVNAVVHNHSPSVIPFGVTDVPLRPLVNTGAFIGLGVPTFEIKDFQPAGDIIISSPYLGNALAGVLGDAPAALMRGHGATVVAETLPLVCVRSIYLEVSANLQMQAITIAGQGGKVVYLEDDEVAATVARQDAKETWRRGWALWRSKAIAELQAEGALPKV